MKKLKKIQSASLKVLMLGLLLVSKNALGLTPDAPNSPDLYCTDPPTTLTAADTLPEKLDSQGFTTMFDGKSFTGFWQSCLSGHSAADNVHGAVWRVDSVTHGIYSTQRGTAGGILMTKRKFGNYEVIFDIWPSFHNDGGFFNRTKADGTCYQTVMDYLPTASFGGTWGEQNYGFRDMRPFAFGGDPTTLNIPGNGGGDKGNWTTFTAALNPTSFGCSAGGCTSDNWKNLWSTTGFNQVRIKFYGGVTDSKTDLTMESFFRKDSTAQWAPLWKDVYKGKVDAASYLGFQVHGNGSFGGDRGNWYRNIKIRKLTDLGAALTVSVVPMFGQKKNDVQSLLNSKDKNFELRSGLRIIDVQGRSIGIVGANKNISCESGLCGERFIFGSLNSQKIDKN